MAKSKKNTNKRSNTTFKIIRFFTLFIAPIVIIVFIVFIVFDNINQPENQVKSRIDALAKYYYEDVIYENMLNSPDYNGSPEEALGKYEKPGLSIVTLRQIILHDKSKTASDAEYLLEYCDQNKTKFRYFPTPPYSRTDYQVTITYSCNY